MLTKLPRRRAAYLVGVSALALLGSGLYAVRALGAQDTTGAPAPDHSLPAPPPNVPGLVVLFGGKQEDIGQNWEQKGKPAKWDFEDGAMLASKTGNISTTTKYDNFQLHVEFRVPYLPDKHGQSRGNSGVFLQGRYEIQVLDSYGIKEPGSGDCGSVYSIAAPLVNACKPPLQWQTYDIAFHAPRFDPTTHERIEPARVTVMQNGITVQNEQEIPRLTHQTAAKKPVASVDGAQPAPAKPAPPAEDLSTPGPITLQWHNAPVAFRNIWIVPLPAAGATHYEPH